MRVILESILATAQTRYPVTICHLMIMGNHVHATLVVDDPNTVKGFVEYVKRESSHAINHLLGRKKHTVWCEGYDSPIILDAEKTIDRIVYLYTNPQKANLVKRIEDYPNLNSWDWFLMGGVELRRKRIPRAVIPPLPEKKLSLHEERKFANALTEQGLGQQTLFIDPDAWMKCFPESAEADPELVNNEIIKRVREAEKLLSEQRKAPVVGAHALRLQRMDLPHIPKTFGIKMICLSSKIALRKRYIGWFRERCEEIEELIKKKWEIGDWLAKLPPGFFAPGGFLFANINPMAAPLSELNYL